MAAEVRTQGDIATGEQSGGSRRRLPWVWKLLALLVVLAAASGAAVFVWRPWVPRTVEDIEQAIAEKRFGPAAEGAERLAAQGKADTRAWFLLARARAGAGDVDSALAALEKIPAFSHRKGEALYFEGKLLIQTHRGRPAEERFQAAILKSSQGDNLRINAQLELLALYAMEERWSEFRSLFWEILPQLDGEAAINVLSMRLRSEFEQTKPEMGIELLEKYVAADPDDANAVAGLAGAIEHKGDLGEALALYEKAAKMAPANLDLQERYLGALLRHGDHDALRQHLAGLSAGALTRPGVLKIRGVIAQGDSRLESALELFESYLAEHPEDAEIEHRRSQVLTRLGRTEEAARATQRRNALNTGRDALRKAWNEFADAYETDPTSVSAELLENLSKACDQAGLPREASAWRTAARQRRAA